MDDAISAEFRLDLLQSRLRAIDLASEIFAVVRSSASRGEALERLTKSPFAFTTPHAHFILDRPITDFQDTFRLELAKEMALLEERIAGARRYKA